MARAIASASSRPSVPTSAANRPPPSDVPGASSSTRCFTLSSCLGGRRRSFSRSASSSAAATPQTYARLDGSASHATGSAARVSSERRVPSARVRASNGTRRAVLAGRPRSRAPGLEGTAERSDARGRQENLRHRPQARLRSRRRHRRASQLRRRRLHVRGAEGQRGLQPAGLREVVPKPEVSAHGRATRDGLRGVRRSTADCTRRTARERETRPPLIRPSLCVATARAVFFRSWRTPRSLGASRRRNSRRVRSLILPQSRT